MTDAPITGDAVAQELYALQAVTKDQGPLVEEELQELLEATSAARALLPPTSAERNPTMNGRTIPEYTVLSRHERAMSRLADLRDADPEYLHQAYDNWLEEATGGEVRRYWRSWMGRFPPWARAPTRCGISPRPGPRRA